MVFYSSERGKEKEGKDVAVETAGYFENIYVYNHLGIRSSF